MTATTSPTASRISADINVTPMIDVLLVLLVIFMLVTPQVRRVLYAALPAPAGAGVDGRAVDVEALAALGARPR